jgi:hypothetical protein
MHMLSYWRASRLAKVSVLAICVLVGTIDGR